MFQAEARDRVSPAIFFAFNSNSLLHLASSSRNDRMASVKLLVEGTVVLRCDFHEAVGSCDSRVFRGSHASAGLTSLKGSSS